VQQTERYRQGPDNLEDLGINGETILKLFLSSMGQWGLDWIRPNIRDKWLAFVKTVMNSRDAQNAGDS
jgi:hypothetical protein